MTYLFKMNKDLLDLAAFEMDQTLSTFLKAALPADDESFDMVNDRGVRRKFTVDWSDGTLHSRGIKRFFAPYEEADYLFIERAEGELRVSSPLTQLAEQKAREGDPMLILNKLAGFQQHAERWFQLSGEAAAFQSPPVDDRLICLPYITEAETFQYQVRTVEAVIRRFKGRVLLGDEVGLGKTVEAGMAMLEYIMRGLVKRVLILTPPSLVQQWENEMKRKFNQDFIKADDPIFKKDGGAAWARHPKIIASLALAKRKQHRELIYKEHYDLVIVDEAHHLRNRNTLAWQFVNELPKKYIFLLTATPVQNHLEELFNLITLLKPGQLKTYSYFKKRFVASQDGIEVKHADQLKMLLADVMIRNKRSTVDVTFTKRKAFTSVVELPKAELQFYADVSTFIRNKYREPEPSISRFQLKNLQEQMGSSFAAMMPALERLASDTKLSAFDRKALQRFRERAQRFVAEGETAQHPKVHQLLDIIDAFKDQVIVFTKYRDTQRLLIDLLRQKGLKVAAFHGGLRRKEKEEQVAYFRGTADVLVSTEVGGEGRNLQFCHGMINYDLPWNPMAIEQRIGRIHRIGQTRDVFVYNLVAKDTIEQYILDLLDRKINMFELVVGEVDAILGDIESETDFSDLMMQAWVRGDSAEEVKGELEQIGDELFENKQKLIKQKALDDRLF
ncbi:MAG: SNF2-related protein [Sporolactobacillus sp.]